MKKRFLAMLLCVAMLLSMMPLSVVAEGESAADEIYEEAVPAAKETAPEDIEPATETQAEQTEEPTVPQTVAETAPSVNAEDPHKTRDGYTKCGHGDENVTWTPVTQASDIKTDVSGHYYLDVDSVLTLSAPIAVSSNVDIVICLNGKNISAPTSGNVRRIFRIAGGSVTVCDCTAHGEGDNYVAGKLIPGISEGGAVGMYGAGAFTMEDVIIDGTGVNNTASSGGGAIIITADGIVNIKSGVIRNCTAQRGGAIYVYKGTLNISGGTLSGNTSRTTGGAISTRDNANDNGTTINITGGTIKNNTANHGGGMFLCNAKSVLLQNVTITGNRANNRGGGVDNQTTSGQSLLTVGGKTVITDNYVGKTLQNLNNVNGGRTVAISTEVPLSEGACIGISARDGQVAATNLAISAATTQTDAHKYFTSDMGHDMTLKDGKVTITGRTHNPGDYKPGHQGVTAWTGTATLPATTGHYYLTGDVYLTAAVGVSTAQDIVLCLNGYDIIQTGAARIYRLSGGAKLTICDCCAHTDADGKYVAGMLTGGNAATGGALFAEGEGTQLNFYDGIITGNTTNGNGTIVNQSQSVFNMYGGEIYGNTATGNGGGLYNSATFNMYGGTIGGTSAIGIYITAGTVNMSDGKITGVSHQSNAGAAVTVKGGTFNLSGGEISGNTSRGVLIDGGTMNLSGTGKVSGNTYSAADCSGIRVNSGKLEMTGGEISGNNSGTASGAGVTVRGGQAILSGGSISGNTAANGGAVLVAGGNVTLSGVTITGNTATNNGVVRIDSGSLNIQAGTRITGNTSSGTRGVLYVNDGSAVMTGGVISDNIGHQDGGAVVLYGGSFAMSGGEISNHSALRGVLVNGGSFSLSGTGKVCNNTFTVTEGAGIRVEAGSFAMSGGEISENDSGDNNGGGLRLKDGTVNITGGKIINNKAKNGAGIIIAGANVNITNTEISGNQAVTSAGGIYLVSGSLNLGEGTVISGNSANYGAGVHISGGDAVINGASITGNTAGKRGAGIDYVSSGTLTVGGKTVISGNKLGSVENNLMLVNGRSFILEPLAEGADVGISAELSLVFETGKLLLAENADQTDLLSFVSYDTKITHTMKVQSDKLYIIQDPKTTHEPHAEDECGHDSVTWKAWSDITSMPNTSGHWYLTCNVNVTSMTAVTTEQEITVCLNGFTVTGVDRIYRLSNGAKVNICDCTAHTDKNGNYVSGKLIPGTSKGGVVGLFTDNENDAAPSFTLYGGIIDGSGITTDASGSAIRLETKGTVNIVDGLIRNCTNAEGVITMTNGVLNISGGKITGNNARGVLVTDGTFNLSGGEIAGNTFDGTEGVGVRIQKGVFNMTGGKIAGNDTLGKNGGGLTIRGGETNLLGGQISENVATAAGAIIMYEGTVTINGTQISDNKATGSGGAIYQMGGDLTIGEKTVISGNTARMGAGIYCIGGDLTIDGAAITGNTATSRGAGVDFASDGMLTINGAAKITDNKVNEKASNLMLSLGGHFVTEGLAEGCKIGINTDVKQMFVDGKQLLGKGVAEKELKYFVSEIAGGHTLSVLEDGLYIMQDPDSVHKSHEKDECGHKDAQWTAWTDTTSLPKTAGHYYLVADVELKSMVAVSTADEITLCLNGYTVKQTGQGQRIYRLSGGAVLNLCDCTAHTDSKGNYISGKLTGGNTDANAGASGIYAAEEGTLVRLYSGKITGNKSEGSGGGMVIFKGAKLEMYGGEVSENTVAGNGAGVYAVDAEIKLLGGRITKNTAKGEAGGVYCGNATATLNGTKITNNVGETAAGGMTVGKESKVEFVSGEITGNKGKNGGGMVIQSKGYVNMTGGRIDRNNATDGNGGGVYVSRDGTFNLRGGSVNSNTSKKTGGGIYVCDKLNIYGGSISGNHAGKEGGGIYITEASWKDENGVVQYSDGVVNMYGGTISGNTTDVSAAGVLVRGKLGYFNLRGGSITGNKALMEKSGCGHGGGIIAQGKGNFTMYDGSITSNEAHQTSGGIGAYSEATVKLYGGTISGNKAYRGGGVYLAGKDALLDGTVVTKNIAEYEGAGVYVSACKLTMDSGVISENELIKGNGAGVVLRTKAEMIFNDGEIVGNKNPEGHAGGILIQSDASLQMNGGLVAENFASLSGGGIRSSRCKVEILGGVIRDNATDVSGGGIYGENTLIMKNCTVTNNRVTGDKGGNSGGAGIYLAQQTKYTLENVTVSGNYAIGKAGGMQIGYRCTGSITGCTFTSNSASGNAGGILAYIMCSLDMKDTVIEANTAVGNGGGILVDPDTSITVTNCAINKNSAKEGGAIHVGAKGMAYIADTEIRDNSALVNGGAIYANGGIYLTDTKITGSANKAESAAVVLDNAGHDGESYIPSVNQFKGNVIISGNFNNDLLLVNDAFVNIHGDGLGDKAEILLLQPEGGITNIVIGPYHYVRSGDIYTITKGETSLTTSDPVTMPEEEGVEDPAEPEGEPSVGNEKAKTIVLVVFGGVFALALILGGIAVAVTLKRKKAKKNLEG